VIHPLVARALRQHADVLGPLNSAIEERWLEPFKSDEGKVRKSGWINPRKHMAVQLVQNTEVG